MGIFDLFTKKKNTSPIPANPLHDAIFVARCQKFDSDPVIPGRTIMVGDSITAGAENFPDLFPGVINQGIPGDTTVVTVPGITLLIGKMDWTYTTVVGRWA